MTRSIDALIKRWWNKTQQKINNKTRKQSVYSMYSSSFFSKTNDRPSRLNEEEEVEDGRTVDRRFSNTNRIYSHSFPRNCRRHLVIIRYSSRRTSNADPWPRLECLGTDDLERTTITRCSLPSVYILFFERIVTTSSSSYICFFFFCNFSTI